MTEWNIYLVIASLLATAVSIGTPVLKLNSSIARLIEKIDNLANDLNSLESRNHESHKKLWDKNEEQDKILNEHENRLRVIEGIFRKNGE